MAGQYFDQETGLHYNYHRYYDPTTGRYLKPDPIGLAGGINLFAYVENNPLSAIDPFGLEGLAIPGGGVQSMTPVDLHFSDRSPDFYSFSFSIAIQLPFYGDMFGYSGQIEKDRYGNYYGGPVGSSFGRTELTGIAFSLTAGWLDYDYESCGDGIPIEEEVRSFMEGGSVNASAGYWLGAGYTYAPKKGNLARKALEVGVMTPQIGISENYSYKRE